MLLIRFLLSFTSQLFWFSILEHNCGIREHGWSHVRHVIDDSGVWHVATDHLAGTHIYGDPRRGTFNQNGHWSINFEEAVPGFDEFLLATGDCSNWLIITKAQVIGSAYDNSG